ncbi:hypothetical protein [Sphingomonas sp. CCH5-D11]|uniref:hypothetical protein n=1 Tax=Sphingomonas sp. CCH5-D11 TaxID=1768786 RepID=UPI00082A006F|nr:hypothetical protein [Sphingomonas sp. CCH5-D11]
MPDYLTAAAKVVWFEEIEFVVANGVKARVQAVKSLGESMSVRDLEALLRECGLSKSESIAVASQFESKSELAEKQAVSDAIQSLIDKMRAA